MTDKKLEALAERIIDKLGARELHKHMHRQATALERLVQQLEAKGLVSAVKTFHRPGADPFLLERAGRQLLSDESPAARSASTSRRKAATRRSSRRARARS
jgi:predicted transcriptional regulator